jgi:hypothetical protein
MVITKMVEQTLRKSSGFTIDSLIGKDSEKVEISSCGRNFEEYVQTTNNDSSRSRAQERPENLERPRRDPSVHDSTRQIPDFAIARRERELYLASHQHSASESLKHLHDVLSQTAGATGTYFAPRVCRHPISPFNLHSVYPGQLPASGPLHPLMLNPSSSRDIRHLHPWISERYSGYYYPRYPGKIFKKINMFVIKVILLLLKLLIFFMIKVFVIHSFVIEYCTFSYEIL